MRNVLFSAVACSVLAGLGAQSVVVPAANEFVRNNAQLNSIIRNQANPRTYQYGVNAAELANIPPGSVINGVSLRFSTLASNTASWPPADITWTDYMIWAGPANPTAGWVADFMANFSSPPQVVRSGPMRLPANSFTNVTPPGTTPNAWSEFYFDFQVPYVYTGGDLALLFSHPGSNDPNLALYPETVPSNAGAHGVGRVQSIYPPGVAGAASTFYVMRLHYGYGSGCPGTAGLVPNLVQNQNTQGGLGGPIRLSIANAPANAVGVFVFGYGQIQIPLPNGCNLWTTPVATNLALLDPFGGAFTVINVPPAMLGGFEAQAVVLDPNGPQGYTASNAVAPRAF